MKKILFGTILACVFTCQNPTTVKDLAALLPGLGITQPETVIPLSPVPMDAQEEDRTPPSSGVVVVQPEMVIPLSPVPKNAEERHNARYFPGPIPRFPGGFRAWLPEPLPSPRPGPNTPPFLSHFTADQENARVGKELRFTAIIEGNLSLATGPITVHLNSGDILPKRVHPMHNDGKHNDGGPNDGVYGLTIVVPRDTVSVNATFTASAMMGASSIGIRNAPVTIRGGDFEIHNGFEGADCLLGEDIPIPMDPAGRAKTRGLTLKDGVWTLHGGCAGPEGKIDGQFGVILTQPGAVLITPWLSGGSSLWFSTRTDGLFAGLELSVSRDGLVWETLPYTVAPRGGTRGDVIADARVNNDFHGYVRWRLMGHGRVTVDTIRLLKREFPPLELSLR